MKVGYAYQNGMVEFMLSSVWMVAAPVKGWFAYHPHNFCGTMSATYTAFVAPLGHFFKWFITSVWRGLGDSLIWNFLPEPLISLIKFARSLFCLVPCISAWFRRINVLSSFTVNSVWLGLVRRGCAWILQEMSKSILLIHQAQLGHTRQLLSPQLMRSIDFHCKSFPYW